MANPERAEDKERESPTETLEMMMMAMIYPHFKTVNDC